MLHHDDDGGIKKKIQEKKMASESINQYFFSIDIWGVAHKSAIPNASRESHGWLPGSGGNRIHFSPFDLINSDGGDDDDRLTSHCCDAGRKARGIVAWKWRGASPDLPRLTSF